MASKTSIKSAKVASPRELGGSKAAPKIRFRATLLRPKATAKTVSWTFLTLPKEASAKLPSRSMTSVEGTFNSLAFQATLEPDGQGGHWLKVDRKMREEDRHRDETHGGEAAPPERRGEQRDALLPVHQTYWTRTIS